MATVPRVLNPTFFRKPRLVKVPAAGAFVSPEESGQQQVLPG